MKKQDFNAKYSSYIEDRFEGCSISNEQFVDFLDKMFEEIIKEHPTLTFSQVKLKFGYVRFYSNLPTKKEQEIQSKLNDFYQTLK